MKALLLLLLLFIPVALSSSSSPIIKKAEKKRTILIKGEIRDLDTQANELASLAAASSEPIHIIIDSPGGSVIAGLRFVQMMERVIASGIELRCYVEGMAASMAMHIYGFCSKRYAYPTSLLLWHPAYMYIRGLPVTEKEAERIRKQLRLLTEYLEYNLKKELKLTEQTYNEYYYNEYFIGASRLSLLSPSFLSIISHLEEN